MGTLGSQVCFAAKNPRLVQWGYKGVVRMRTITEEEYGSGDRVPDHRAADARCDDVPPLVTEADIAVFSVFPVPSP